MNHYLKAAALAALAMGLGPAALAAEFSVTPVRIFMEAKDRAIAVTVANEGTEEVVMQADLYTWKQKPGGEDDLVLTEDMILSPPILKLAPKTRQVVRLARLSAQPVGEQLTYRMIVREIPEARPASRELKLQIALAFSLPVFITPPGAKRQLQCVTQRVSPDTVNAVCENRGNAYAQPREFTLVAENGDKLASRDSGGYILPDIKRTFEIKREGAKIPAGKAKLQVALDDGTTQTFDAALPE
ncbi:MAG: molecular chaperone [Burkholderiales bacterium]|nr:molecular chaperone [Burkholderiales bacterium]